MTKWANVLILEGQKLENRHFQKSLSHIEKSEIENHFMSKIGFIPCLAREHKQL